MVKVLYASVEDPRDRSAWSGIPFRVLTSLGAQLEVEPTGPLRRSWLDVPVAVLQRARNTLLRDVYLRQREPVLLRSYGHQIDAAVTSSGADVVLTTSTLTVPHISPGVPVVLWGGSTFDDMVDYYPEFTGLSPRTLRVGSRTEVSALRRADRVITASTWAADSVVGKYGVRGDRVHVVPWGGLEPEIEAGPRPTDSVCRLLVVGGDWSRKGVDIACEVVEVLRSTGTEALLTVVGVEPPASWVPALGVRILPRLDRRDPLQTIELERLFHEASFLLSLSRAEAYGQVVNEASAYGLPVVATATGGLTSAVIHGQNGFLCAPGASARDIASVISTAWTNEQGYRALRATSRKLFDDERSWTAVAKKVATVLQMAAER